MVRYAEVVYEGGAHSVVAFESDDELQGALIEQHRRAISGEDGGPAGHNAERVRKVIVYDENPGDYGADKMVSAESLNALLSGMTDKNGKVNADQLIAAVRDEVSPVYPVNQGKHESQFKADGADYPLDFLGGAQ